jgi:iron complex outermembrane receptor protein
VLVQRIDTVTGGASAAYGSGAVAGVINVILDHKLEGGKLNADTRPRTAMRARQARQRGLRPRLFDNRVHFVLGGEFQKQDAAGLSGRSHLVRRGQRPLPDRDQSG